MEKRNWQGVSVINKQDVARYCLPETPLDEPTYEGYSGDFVDQNAFLEG